jgi:hypothetical protein
MSINTHTFQTVLAPAYELDAKPVNGAEISDLSSVKIYDKYPDDYRIENFGIFTLQKFKDSNGNYYNLIYCEQNFPLNAELMAGMDHVEIVSFKRYELIEQIKPVKGYYLFKLVPHTVQGIPAW